MSIRKVWIALFAVCASLLLVPVAASAATGTPVTKLKTVHMNGKSRSGKKFSGQYTIDRFATRHGKSYAVGTLTGKLGGKKVKRSNVFVPVHMQKTGAASAAAMCPILHLVIGPVNLDLLGLHVTLGGGLSGNQPIVLDITAQSGNGNLLGNLLCSVAGLLDQNPLATQLSGLLNILQQLLNVPGLLSL
jgi:hypothetical protein